MKHNILSFAAAAVLALTFSACDDCQIRENESEGSGTLSFASLSVDVSVAENVMRNAPARDGSAGRSVDLSDFIVSVSNAAGETVKQWKYSEMPELMTLPVATGYTVEVKSHEVQKAEWDRPYYYGTKTFDIADGVVTEIGEVLCKFASIKVSIRYADDLRAVMGSDAKVNVLVNDQGSLDFMPDETRSGYFEAVGGSSTLVATFTGTLGGYAERLQRTFTDVTAGQHRIITFKLKSGNPDPDPETGKIDPSGISVDLEVRDVDLNGNVNVGDDNLDSDDRPGSEVWPDDPPIPGGDDEPETITFVSEYLDLNGGVNKASEFGLAEDGLKPAVVVITSENPIDRLEVKIDSESLTPALLQGVGLTDKFDLANPGELAAALTGLGLPNGDAVKGKNNVNFDISKFMELLGIYPNAMSTFIITLTDNAGGVKSQSIIFSTYE